MDSRSLMVAPHGALDIVDKRRHMLEVLMDGVTIRSELVAVLDRLAELPDDAISERADLRARQVELCEALADANDDDLAVMQQEWNDQAGAKLPPDMGDPTGRLPSPNDGGTGA